MVHEISEEDILRNKENEPHKGENGVLNSADEYFMTPQIFLNGTYRELNCVCSPVQVTRNGSAI